MPKQVTTSHIDKIILPDGIAFEISIDEGASFTNVGVMGEGATATYNYDKIEVESGNAGKLISRIKNQTIAVAPSALMTMDPEVWKDWGGGAFTYSAIAGTPVGGANQIIQNGAWALSKFIKIANQNADGSAITVNSVTGSVDGALVLTTNYLVTQNEKGEYGILITSATLAQDITIDYDYTPADGKQITAGTSSVQLARFWVRMRHYTDDALTQYDQEMMVYGVDMDSGLQFNFKGANQDGVEEVTVAFTANVDVSRPDGEQLFKLFIANAAYVGS